MLSRITPFTTFFYDKTTIFSLALNPSPPVLCPLTNKRRGKYFYNGISLYTKEKPKTAASISQVHCLEYTSGAYSRIMMPAYISRNRRYTSGEGGARNFNQEHSARTSTLDFLARWDGKSPFCGSLFGWVCSDLHYTYYPITNIIHNY